jgi:hypothetical protein
MRAWAIIAAVAALAALGTAARATPGAPAATYYVVRPDPRLCPSPLCGGVWARRVNRPLTRCADGTAARECYVAATAGIPEKLWSALAGSLLVRGRIVQAGIEGFPGLGRLDAGAAWRPAGPRPPAGTTFRVVDTGIRCVATPCFSLRAEVLEAGRRRMLSDLDLAGVGAAEGDLRRALLALPGRGVLVTGTVRRVPDAGPAGAGQVLAASQLWLRP